MAIVGPTNSFWVSMYLQWQPSRLQARVSTATLMSFNAQPAADRRLVRPEHGGPGNNERPVSVLNKQWDSPPSPLQKSNRICTICRNGPRQSGESRCSILAKWLRHWLKSRSIGVVSERWTWVRFIQGLGWIFGNCRWLGLVTLWWVGSNDEDYLQDFTCTFQNLSFIVCREKNNPKTSYACWLNFVLQNVVWPS